MKRQLGWVLTAACLCTGCAGRPISEAQVLTSNIVYGRSSNVTCGAGEVRYCELDNIGRSNCACVDHNMLFPPPR
jgi:hypothetical protein